MKHLNQCIKCGHSDPIPLDKCTKCDAPLHLGCSKVERWVDDQQVHREKLLCPNCYSLNPESRRPLHSSQLGVCGRFKRAVDECRLSIDRIQAEKAVVEGRIASVELQDPCSQMSSIRRMRNEVNVLNSELGQVGKLRGWLMNRHDSLVKAKDTRDPLLSSLWLHYDALLNRQKDATRELERCEPLATRRSKAETQFGSLTMQLKDFESKLTELLDEYVPKCGEPTDQP